MCLMQRCSVRAPPLGPTGQLGTNKCSAMKEMWILVKEKNKTNLWQVHSYNSDASLTGRGRPIDGVFLDEGTDPSAVHKCWLSSKKDWRRLCHLAQRKAASRQRSHRVSFIIFSATSCCGRRSVPQHDRWDGGFYRAFITDAPEMLKDFVEVSLQMQSRCHKKKKPTVQTFARSSTNAVYIM